MDDKGAAAETAIFSTSDLIAAWVIAIVDVLGLGLRMGGGFNCIDAAFVIKTSCSISTVVEGSLVEVCECFFEWASGDEWNRLSLLPLLST